MPRSPNPGFKPVAALRLGPLLARRGVRWFLAVWALLVLLVWGAYWSFADGHLPGVHLIAAWGGQWLTVAALLLLVGTLLGLPVLGVAVGLLGIGSLWPRWRRVALGGLRQLLLVALGWGLLVMALVPAFYLGYFPQSSLRVAAWERTYHSIYLTFPTDDNYGDLALVECGQWGLCYQRFRSFTDSGSARDARLVYDARRDQLALTLESRWVYLRHRHEEVCNLTHAPWHGTDCPNLP